MAVSSKATALPVFIAAIVLATGAGIWMVSSGGGRTQPAKKTLGPSDFEATELVHSKNVALAALENRDYSQADPLLREIATAGSWEPVGPRNWAINRLSAVAKLGGTTDRQIYLNELEKADYAVGFESKLELTGPARHIMESNLARLSDRPRDRLLSMRTAAVIDAKDPVIQHEYYRALREAGDNPIGNEDVKTTLKAVRELVPENLYVQLEWLTLLAHRKDAAIASALDQSRRIFGPFFDEKGRTRCIATLAAASAAVKSKDWPAVIRQVDSLARQADGLSAVRCDRRRVEQGLDWYMVSDFSESFYRQHNFVRTLPSAAAPVRFQVEPIDGPLGDLSDVRDAVIVPAQHIEIAVLRNSVFELYGQSLKDEGESGGMATALRGHALTDMPTEAGGHGTRKSGSDKPLREPGRQWRRLAAAPLPSAGFDHCLAVNLDAAARRTKPADPDFLVFGPAGVAIVENRFSRTHSPSLRVVRPRGLADKTKDVKSVAAIDFDNDGELDLVVAGAGGISVWRNRGQSEFEQINSRSTLSASPIKAKELLAVDWNQDRDVDLFFVAESGAPNAVWLRGSGEGRFRTEPINATPSDAPFQKLTTLAIFDADCNGSWDILAAGPQEMSLLRSVSIQAGFVKIMLTTKVADFAAEKLFVFDYDNDGCPDVLAWNRGETRCFHGEPHGQLRAVPDVLPAGLPPIVGVDCGDFDDDGDSDLLVVTAGAAGGRLQILKNEGGNANHWIDVRLESGSPGADDPHALRVNPAAIGALLQLKSGPVCQMQTVRKQATHFGIGTLDRVDVVRVVWPTGVASNVLDLPKNRVFTQLPERRVFSLEASDATTASPAGRPPAPTKDKSEVPGNTAPKDAARDTHPLAAPAAAK